MIQNCVLMTVEVYKMIIQKYSYTIHTELIMALNLLFRINKEKNDYKLHVLC